MDAPCTSLRDLPTEIVQGILALASEGYASNVVWHYLFICRSWVKPAQSFLYTHALITSPSRLEQFYAKVKKQPHLGESVEKFTLDFETEDHAVRNTVSQLLVELFSTLLPNLKRFEEVAPDLYWSFHHWYKDIYAKDFKRIKCSIDQEIVTYTPSYYVTSAVLSQGRVESFRAFQKLDGNYLDNGNYGHTSIVRSDIPEYDYMEALHSGNGVQHAVHVGAKTTDDILLLEHVMKGVSEYGHLSFEYSSPNPSKPRIDLSEITSKRILETLTCIGALAGEDYSVLSYIMHKFPTVGKIRLGLTLDDSHCLDEVLSLFLDYLHGPEDYEVSVVGIDPGAAIWALGDSWSMTHGSKEVSLDFFIKSKEGTIGKLDMYKEEYVYHRYFITLSQAEMDRIFIDFLEDHGYNVLNLSIKFEDDDNCELPAKMLIEALEYCPQLDCLNLHSCILTPSMLDFDNNLRIDNIHLHHCRFKQGALEEVSAVIDVIHDLAMLGFLKRDRKDQQDIHMPSTVIRSITFEEDLFHKNFFKDARIYIRIINEHDTHYFYFNKMRGGKHSCTSQEFLNHKEGHIHFTITCKGMPDIAFDCI